MDHTARKREVHVSCDATQRAYSSVGNLCTKDSEGHVEVAFLTAGSRVAPKRQLSMPRLKLCAALTGAQLVNLLTQVFPSAKQDASAVAKALLTEIIPRWGIPTVISSDNGPGFVSQALSEVSHYLGFDIRHHCSYQPQSAGAVERENGTIKAKLAKCCGETGLSWVKSTPASAFPHAHTCKKQTWSQSI